MGGFMFATGVLISYVAVTAFQQLRRGARFMVSLASLTSIGWMAMVPSKQVGIFYTCMWQRMTAWQKGNGWSRMAVSDILPVKVESPLARTFTLPENTTVNGSSRMVPSHLY